MEVVTHLSTDIGVTAEQEACILLKVFLSSNNLNSVPCECLEILEIFLKEKVELVLNYSNPKLHPLIHVHNYDITSF